ncbi:hypothetical protein CR513_35724, partial [Mucuna pruriens]
MLRLGSLACTFDIIPMNKCNICSSVHTAEPIINSGVSHTIPFPARIVIVTNFVTKLVAILVAKAEKLDELKELVEKLDKVGKGLDSVQRDTQSMNAKVKALSREKDERPKVVFMHESDGSFEGENVSESERSSRSSMRDRCERHVRDM